MSKPRFPQFFLQGRGHIARLGVRVPGLDKKKILSASRSKGHNSCFLIAQHIRGSPGGSAVLYNARYSLSLSRMHIDTSTRALLRCVEKTTARRQPQEPFGISTRFSVVFSVPWYIWVANVHVSISCLTVQCNV